MEFVAEFVDLPNVAWVAQIHKRPCPYYSRVDKTPNPAVLSHEAVLGGFKSLGVYMTRIKSLYKL